MIPFDRPIALAAINEGDRVLRLPGGVSRKRGLLFLLAKPRQGLVHAPQLAQPAHKRHLGSNVARIGNRRLPHRLEFFVMFGEKTSAGTLQRGFRRSMPRGLRLRDLQIPDRYLEQSGLEMRPTEGPVCVGEAEVDVDRALQQLHPAFVLPVAGEPLPVQVQYANAIR